MMTTEAQKTFAILITTKNRLPDLIFTLEKISPILSRVDVECIICDDGSDDGTFLYLQRNFKNVRLLRNEESKGLIFSRNRLLSEVTADFAISIDDDLHFVTENPLELIYDYFNRHPMCAVVSFRIFWSKSEPITTQTSSTSCRIKTFAGGAHALRMAAWRQIPDYPDWFIFYGEEDFASYHFFKREFEIHYLPTVLTNHRVEMKLRQKNNDYVLRMRRSMRAGWYIYFLFLPWRVIPRKMAYSLWMHLKHKVFSGNTSALLALIQALCDLLLAMPKLLRQSNRLTENQYLAYLKLEDTLLYWKPENEA